MSVPECEAEDAVQAGVQAQEAQRIAPWLRFMQAVDIQCKTRIVHIGFLMFPPNAR